MTHLRYYALRNPREISMRTFGLHFAPNALLVDNDFAFEPP